ncbi:urea carboxylase [Candidatus Methylopumilus turicensis]|uniref:Urea carboxylase n=1 Tax=Candidatus Methylopumilus turicensis TaxID=1581680 RepID=A0A0B7J270_9PROT|nr:urea carboxylase [Candidatus Methylopumilus turicensis]CEN56739.1 Urea carboxylase [Candidatus Methylopumilus turicensis]
MFTKVLIANRGEIACRVIRTLKKMGIQSVAIYSEADANARHVLDADEAYCVGPAPAADSYLNADKILEIAQKTGAQGIHPGYGFLSENASFAERCEALGIAFIGPSPQQMRDFGLKHTARALAEQNGVPLLPGTGLLSGVDEAKVQAENIGYPVMLKSTAGGGGIGMQLIWGADELESAFASVQRLSSANFKDTGIYLEKYVQAARHIEVQIFGNGLGDVIALGERDCSVQRRNQKVIEETPAPNITQEVRDALAATAVKLGKAIHYRSAGTVEFVYDKSTGKFYFLEVNTRLQVEHGVTELVNDVDLVEWMIRIAAGESDAFAKYQHQPSGHAIQVRLYAEDANKNFQPSSGVLTEVKFSPNARIDTWIETGSDVSPFYDPLVAKVLVHAKDRSAAVTSMKSVLDETRISGIETNLEYLRQVLADDVFPAGEQITRYLNTFNYQPHTLDVLDGGVMTTIQDYPGRMGYWAVGVPPSGPMDHLAFRFGNKLVGNIEGEAGLEITLIGPKLKFNKAAVIAITGAPIDATLDGAPIALWQSHHIQAGSVLKLGKVEAHGCRTYLSIQGGFDVPNYLGSKSTFTLGQFGGHGGRAIRVGDVLPLSKETAKFIAKTLPVEMRPVYTSEWEIGVLYGPHGAPDFFTDDDIAMFFSTDWEVHYNSNTTGIRLIGPKPTWARKDGGEAGLHPSNIHDNAYAIGTVDFTGDMPVILGPDGPSLGGFVCPATIVQAELWKMGQLKAGDKIRFKRLTQDEARQLELAQHAEITTLTPASNVAIKASTALSFTPILGEITETETQVKVVYRQAGDKYLLVEYGPLVLDLTLRFRIHALMQWLEKENVQGILNLTPGIRSLQVHYDSLALPVEKLLTLLKSAEALLPAVEEMEVPTRIVHLPLSWDDAATKLAIEKYMQSVRKDAPWCPSNIEFIRRINGLDSIEDVKQIVFGASYLTLGLGDVYLGAPVATPVDPRHRLVTTKYNPARTWTPENAVGIGGAYMCVYGMEGPGGYQFVGRTIQMWNRWNQTKDFKDGKPWLLRFFDQIRFYPVSEAELLQMREDFPRGKFQLKIEEQTFKLKDYTAFLNKEAESIATFKGKQQASFDAERERWIASGQANYSNENEAGNDVAETLVLADGSSVVSSHVAGNLWQIKVNVGDEVTEGDVVVVVESMKMEISVTASCSGTVTHVLCQEGSAVAAGQQLLVIAEK